MHENPAIAALLNGLNNPSLPSIDLSLARMQQLLAALGSPEKKLPPVIHLAGTNGKGSTLAFLKSIYQAAGYRVHAYTSPHLVRFNERIVIAGQEVSDDYLLQLLERVSEAAQAIPVTFFEATTAAAFLAFAEHAADVVLLETGLGGRLDATNVVAKPMATIITPIDYDHMEFLGSTLGAIAGEKAGIMKAGVPCFAGAQKPEAREGVVFTGGEPLLQLDSAMIDAAHAQGFFVAVESNGTLAPPPGIDWLCVSPKAGSPLRVSYGQELKLVFPQSGLAPDEFEALAFERLFLQPMDGPDRERNTREAIAFCLAHPSWRLSLQTHKMIGIP